jgi:hypothetical protein
MTRPVLRPLSVFVAVCGIAVALLFADGGANHQVSTDLYGSSGGNVNNIGSAFCCSGTLGALVTDGSAKYILSNNHILANTNQAAVGDDVSQPGLIDNSCRPAEIVADFTAAPLLGPSNVDAAIAELRAGAMDANGAILDIGAPNTAIAAATINGAVAKSGRTTGLTCGQVQSVSTTVKVQYQQGCNQGRKFFVTYTNQVVVGGGGFSAGGDSGSLIVTQTDAHPTALLYAGSSTTTIGNPIGEVLTQVGNALGGATMTVVGQNNRTADVTCSGGGGGRPPHAGPPQNGVQAERAKNAHVRRLMADPAVMAVGVGAAEDDPAEAVVVIYVEAGRSHAPMPTQLNGVRTRIIRTDRIRAYGWNEEMEKPLTCGKP